MNKEFIFILWAKWHVANFDMSMWCRFGWHMSSSNLINLMTLIWNLPLNFDMAFCNWLDKFLPPTEAILNRVVELEGVEKLGGSVVSGSSSLWGVSTSHQWKQWLLSSLARFHTNNNAKRSVSVSGLFGFYMDAKKVQRVKWKREEKWYGEYGVHVDFFFFLKSICRSSF